MNKSKWATTFLLVAFMCYLVWNNDELFESKGAKLGSLAFLRADFNFGEAVSGSNVIATYNCKNTSNDLVIIERIETNCGCMTTNVLPIIVGPHKSTEIVIKLNLPSVESTRRLRKRATVELSTGETLALEMEGMVTPWITFPNRLALSPDGLGTFTGTMNVKRGMLERNFFKNVRISRAINCRVENLNQMLDSTEIKVTVDADRDDGTGSFIELIYDTGNGVKHSPLILVECINERIFDGTAYVFVASDLSNVNAEDRFERSRRTFTCVNPAQKILRISECPEKATLDLRIVVSNDRRAFSVFAVSVPVKSVKSRLVIDIEEGLGLPHTKAVLPVYVVVR